MSADRELQLLVWIFAVIPLVVIALLFVSPQQHGESVIVVDGVPYFIP